MTPVVIDSCSIHEFQKERILEKEDIFSESIDHILETTVIAMDEEQLILNEWNNTCCSKGDTSLEDWVAFQIGDQKIVLFPIRKDGSLEKKLNDAGMPRKDQRYIFLAHTCSAQFIASEDIDFFEPKQKNAKSAYKKKIKNNQCGTINKIVKKHFGSIISSLSTAKKYVK